MTSADHTAAADSWPRVLDVHLLEYEKLKEEQAGRIHFRDNLVYVALLVVGTLGSYAARGAVHSYAWLVIPWASGILGWMYVINDEKATRIGRYVREVLRPKVVAFAGGSSDLFFEWEEFHVADQDRQGRKFVQLVVDQLVFVVPGLVALVIFAFYGEQPHGSIWLIVAADACFALWIGAEILRYSPFGRSRTGVER